jgi:hypothetical protein
MAILRSGQKILSYSTPFVIVGWPMFDRGAYTTNSVPLAQAKTAPSLRTFAKIGPDFG